MEPTAVAQNENSAVNVMDALRDSTKDMHNDAEGHEFQKSLGSGRLDEKRYVSYLGQLYLIHKHLAELLGKAAKENSKIDNVVQSYHHDHSAVEGDIAHFDKSAADAVALNATKKICAKMDELVKSQPAALLGHLYVLEGSTNGAKFMAKSIIAGMGLPEDRGASYFDRYGDKQRERWTAFKDRMNGNNFSAAEIDQIVAAGKDMFIAFFEIGDELSIK